MYCRFILYHHKQIVALDIPTCAWVTFPPLSPSVSTIRDNLWWPGFVAAGRHLHLMYLTNLFFLFFFALYFSFHLFYVFIFASFYLVIFLFFPQFILSFFFSPSICFFFLFIYLPLIVFPDILLNTLLSTRARAHGGPFHPHLSLVLFTPRGCMQRRGYT